mmetsp:Transcript_10623/g.65500  ORF Transcript_10623/g.65500 Transcript_10623/m.65500 type:complete len:215 (+) Transcript_10623:1367-2011(+)
MIANDPFIHLPLCSVHNKGVQDHVYPHTSIISSCLLLPCAPLYLPLLCVRSCCEFFTLPHPPSTVFDHLNHGRRVGTAALAVRTTSRVDFCTVVLRRIGTCVCRSIGRHAPAASGERTAASRSKPAHFGTVGIDARTRSGRGFAHGHAATLLLRRGSKRMDDQAGDAAVEDAAGAALRPSLPLPAHGTHRMGWSIGGRTDREEDVLRNTLRTRA